MDGRAWRAETDGDFRADGDEIEMPGQQVQAQVRGLAAAIEAHRFAGKAGTYGNSRPGIHGLACLPDNRSCSYSFYR
ncbi:hypothetical protein D3C76_575310 [compost metagenome]